MQIKKSFDCSNPGARTLDKFVALEKLPNSFAFHNGQPGKIGPANDSIHMYNAATCARLHQLNALAQTTLAGGKYFHLGTSDQASRDSMVNMTNQVFRFPDAYSNNMPNWNREIADVLHINNKMDVRTAFPTQFLTQNKGRVELRAMPNPALPWKEWNVCGTNNPFLDHFEIQDPYIPVKQGIGGTTLYSQKPIILGEYTQDPDFLTPDGLNVST